MADAEKARDGSIVSKESTTSQTRDPSPVEKNVPVPAPPAAKPSGPAALPGPFDSGLQAWLQVVGTFAVWVNTWGLFNAYGEYQTYYQNELLSNKSASDIAWIGSLQAFLLLVLGVVSGPMLDAGYFRVLMIVGNFLVVFGMMMTSLCSEYWQIILAQGVVVGAGMGLLFTPVVSLIPQWFVKRKALAGGLAASGSGIGGVIYPIVFHKLQPTIGFGWATRVIGFLSLFFAIVAIATLKSKIERAPKMRSFIDTTALKEPPYLLYCVAGFCGFCAMYVPWFYIAQYSLDLNISSASFAPYLVVLINAGSVIGRICLSPLADIYGLMNVASWTLFCSAVLAFAWIGIKNLAGLIVFAILYGMFAGNYLAIASIVCVPLTADLRVLGTRIGMISIVASFAVLVGTPISGAILVDTGKFVGIQVFTGVLLIVSSIGIYISKSSKFGWNPLAKH